MRTFISILLLTIVANAFAGTPDSVAVAKLYSTSWTLTKRYTVKQGSQRLHKVDGPRKERLTIYSNEVHIDVDSTYQVCAMRHRNQNELWLDCKRADQLIYRVIEIKGDELTIDVLVKQRDGKYVRTGRRCYQRARS